MTQPAMTDEQWAIEILSDTYGTFTAVQIDAAKKFAIAALREVEQSRAAVEAWEKLDSILHKKDNLDVEFCYCKEIDGDGNITEDGISCRIRDYDRTKSNYEAWRETEPFTTAQAAILAAKGG